MGKLALVVILILLLIPPHSRVIDPEQCLGICLFDGSTPVEHIVSDDGRGS
jgi:hypothetical protein